MALLLGLVLATLGVVLCIAAGLFFLFIPRWRHLTPYALLVYPSAYAAGLLCFFFFGFVVDGITERYSNSNLVGWLVDWIGVLLTFGLVSCGALAGGISGLAWANRLWWRFFADSEQRAASLQSSAWPGLTLEGKIRAWFLYHWASLVGNQASPKGSTVPAHQERDKYQARIK